MCRVVKHFVEYSRIIAKRNSRRRDAIEFSSCICTHYISFLRKSCVLIVLNRVGERPRSGHLNTSKAYRNNAKRTRILATSSWNVQRRNGSVWTVAYVFLVICCEARARAHVDFFLFDRRCLWISSRIRSQFVTFDSRRYVSIRAVVR